MNYVVYMNEVPDIVFHLFLFGRHRLLGMVDPSLGLFGSAPEEQQALFLGTKWWHARPLSLDTAPSHGCFYPCRIRPSVQTSLKQTCLSTWGEVTKAPPSCPHSIFFFFLLRHYLQGPSPRAVMSTLVTHSRLSLTPTLAQSN